MKKPAVFLGIWAIAVLATVEAGAEPFYRALSPQEFSAAGLAKLSSEELAQLDGLFAKYRAYQLPAPVQPTQKTPPVDLVRVKPTAPIHEPAADTDGLIAKTKKLFSQPKGIPHPLTVEGQIDGSFEGWTRLTVWRLKDGTRWQAENNQPGFISRPVRDPKVKIYPAAINGYWLELPELDQKVRVRQLP